MIKNTSNAYGSISKLLHWLIGLTVIGMLVLGTILEYIKDDALAGNMYMIHKSIGLTILALMVFRIAWRLTNITPNPTNHVRPWQQSAEKAVHYIFYIALLVMPLSGWMMSTASEHIPSFFGYGLIAMPLVPVSKSLATTASWVHTISGYTLIALVSLHILATIQHYVVHKDNILKRML